MMVAISRSDSFLQLLQEFLSQPSSSDPLLFVEVEMLILQNHHLDVVPGISPLSVL